jgi:hypothetical protein
MRPLTLIAAVILIGFAAYGLSPTAISEDYCLPDGLETQWWPPGVHCVYEPSVERGTGPAEPDTAHVGAFFAILVAGLALVLGRRSRLALGAAVVFGFAGIAAALLGWLQVLVFGCVFGVAAYWLTRSVAASLLPVAALLAALTVQFITDAPLAWAGALLLLALIPPRIRPAASAPRPLSST